MTRLEELSQFGQSVWLDFISRRLIKSGRLQELISMGLLGMTSNPTIFDNAISKSDDYDDLIGLAASRGVSLFDIYDQLTIRDIQEATDLFRPVYERTNGVDGYVSLEINPRLASDTEETIEEGRRLQRVVNRPNLMLKVPATEEGFPAISTLLSDGININVTLIFGLGQYEKTARAYLEGLKRYRGTRTLHSVASVFVSRIDSAVDKLLEGKSESLKGKAAVANSFLIYRKHREIFASPEFDSLKAKGAAYQRVLWASTSTKNPTYRDIKYVEELIMKNTVNTLPENTMMAFLDHGSVADSIPVYGRNVDETMRQLMESGVDMDKVCGKLLDDGVKSFIGSFDSLLASIETKARKLTVKG